MGSEQGLDLVVVGVDAGAQGIELSDEGFYMEDGGIEDGGIVGQGDGFGDDFEPPVDEGGASGSVAIVELAHGFCSGFLEGLEGGPFFQEAAGERGMEVFAGQFEGFWEVVLQSGDELVVDFGAQIDQGSAGFDEGSELSGLGIVGFLHGKFAVGFEDELGDALAVALVGLGPGGLEGFAPVFEGGGVDEIEIDEVVLDEKGGEVGAGLFDTECELAVGKVTSQLQEPIPQGGGLGIDFAMAVRAGVGVQDGEIDGAIGSVDADESGIGNGSR